MRENRIAVEIDAPVSKVFDFTVDPANTPRWIEDIVRVNASTSRVELGTVFRNLDRGGRYAEYKVVAMEKDRKFELKQIGGPYHVLYTYEPLSAEKTKLTYMEWSDDGYMRKPFAQEVFDNLKRLIESE